MELIEQIREKEVVSFLCVGHTVPDPSFSFELRKVNGYLVGLWEPLSQSKNITS